MQATLTHFPKGISRNTLSSLRLEKTISNQEEVKPQARVQASGELPLVVFTLCGQTAAGLAVASLFSGPLSIPLLAAIGGLIGLGALASIFHLGAPLNAWRALNHLRKSCSSSRRCCWGNR